MNETIRGDWEIIRYENEEATIENETLAIEYPITVMVQGNEFATIVCSPTHIEALVVGFLASEGIIRLYEEIISLEIDEARGFAYAEVINPPDVLEQEYTRRFIGSCCGKSRQFYFKHDARTAKTIMTKSTIHVQQCFKLMEQLQMQSNYFKKTGGVHNAALCTTDNILTVRADIGRHNALDKVYGEILMGGISVKEKLIVFSGRISSEVLLKVAKIGIGLIISKSAPTDLALQLADDLNITIAGFARGNKINIYTHPDRIILPEINGTNVNGHKH